MSKRRGPNIGAVRLYHRFTSKPTAEIYVGDALAFLKSLKSGSAHIVFLDPPFNLGKNYGTLAPDSKPGDSYAAWLATILAEAVRVLADGGALYLYHLPSWAIRVAGQLNASLTFQHWIAISMKNGFVRGRRLYPAHYALLFYTKGRAMNLNRPKLPVEYCECGRTKKDYGGYRHIVEEHGLNLSDIWEDISPVRHRRTKRRAANELPQKLTDRVVAISGGKGLVFVDPFAGGGSAVLSAAKANMTIKACDLIDDYAAIQVAALEQLKSVRGER